MNILYNKQNFLTKIFIIGIISSSDNENGMYAVLKNVVLKCSSNWGGYLTDNEVF